MSAEPEPQADPDVELRWAYLKHAPAVHRHAARAALGDYQRAEEATNDAFLEAVRVWPEFRLMPAAQQLAWLSARARWRVIESWRRSSRVVPVEVVPEAPTSGTAEDAALSTVTLDRFWKVVTAMPARAARAAYLRWHEEWTQAEIADHLGVNRRTVRRDLDAVSAAAREQLADEPDLPLADNREEQ